jgi:hypothetical protein
MKRIVFKLKHEPAEVPKENPEWRSYTVRDFPKLPTWVHFAGLAILAGGIGIGSWVRHPIIGFFAGMAGCFGLVMAVRPLRCPQCNGSLLTRDVEGENGFKRFFHDCPMCKISWRDQKQHASSSDD